MPAPTTAVIGAGISGLTTAKMLSDYDVPYTCFETSDRIGGNWAFGNPNGRSSAHRSLHIDTSKHKLSIKDYPMPESYPDFPHRTRSRRTWTVTHARSTSRRTSSADGVVHAEPVDGSGWELDLEGGSIRHADLLVVADGHHWDPRMAEFPGELTGTEIHSHHYIDPQTPLDFTGRSILVVGLGNSTDPYLPLAWQRKAAQLGQSLLTGRPEPYGLPPRITASSKHIRHSRWNYPLRLGSGDLPPKPDIRRLDGRTVHFEDGTCGEFDVIVYATGYNITFPSFDEDFISASSPCQGAVRGRMHREEWNRSASRHRRRLLNLFEHGR